MEDIVHLVDESSVATRLEGVLAREHLVENQAETIPIDREAVLLVFDDLRGQVLRRAAEWFGHALRLLKATFRQTEVSQSDVTFTVDQNVLWLDISVNHTGIMKVLKSKDNLGSVELRPVLFESALVLQMEKEFSAVDELHDQIQVMVVLERKLKFHDKGMIELFKNFPLDYKK